jgi:hypothetical protein
VGGSGRDPAEPVASGIVDTLGSVVSRVPQQRIARALHLLIVAAALGLAGSGCPGSTPPCTQGTLGCRCTATGACLPGLQCRDLHCAADTGMPDAAVMPTEPRAIGASCSLATECREGLCLSSESLPGGYCSKACGAQMLTGGDGCPDGSACTAVNQATSVCMALCGAGRPTCRFGYVCASSGGASVCQARCTNDRSCRSGFGCNTLTGQCEPGVREPGPLGAACQLPGQCLSNLCLTEAASGGTWAGGSCVGACTAADEDQACSSNEGICIGLPQADGGRSYTCLGDCTTGVDCRPEYFCSPVAAASTADGRGVCLPRCDRLGCRPGFTCDTAVGACVEGGMTGTAVVERFDLGSTMLGRRGTDFKTFSITVPDGAVSFSLIAQAIDPQVTAALIQVTTPGGQVVYDYFDPTRTDYRGPVALYVGQPMAMVYPNAPRLTLMPGNHQLVLAADSLAPSEVRVNVLIKKQSGVLQGGTMPVGLWFTKQQHLTAQTARTDARFQAALTVLSQIYGGVGIQLGPFTYSDLSGPDAEALAVIQDSAQLGALFAHANQSDSRALNYFFIEQFNLEGGAGVIGVSGGLPGPPGLPGLPHGGVAVALSLLIGNSDVLAETMAHEGGHFLGLFHTSERTGQTFDPLLDTPECPSSADINVDMMVDNKECAGKGADNLMFWSTTGMAPQRALTNDQRFVLLRNPVVQ